MRPARFPLSDRRYVGRSIAHHVVKSEDRRAAAAPVGGRCYRADL